MSLEKPPSSLVSGFKAKVGSQPEQLPGMAAIDRERNAERAVGYVFTQCKSSYWQEAFGDG